MSGACGDEAEEFRFPFGVTADEEGTDIIRVCVVIQGLKAKLIGDEASNARVEVMAGKQSLSVTVRMTDPALGKYKWEAKKLAGTIDPSKTKQKVKKDQVVIKLYKDPVESWASRLADTGIDAHESEDSESD